MAAADAIAAAIMAAFQDTKNGMGPVITKVEIKKGPGGVTTVVPTPGTAQLDSKMAKAIAGAVADGLAKFLP